MNKRRKKKKKKTWGMKGGEKTKVPKKNLPPLRGKVLEWSIFATLNKKQFLRVREKHFSTPSYNW